MEADKQKDQLKIKWLKRIGLISFLFFLAKGLVWIALFVLAWLGLKG
jgi:hypothetical protein